MKINSEKENMPEFNKLLANHNNNTFYLLSVI